MMRRAFEHVLVTAMGALVVFHRAENRARRDLGRHRLQCRHQVPQFDATTKANGFGQASNFFVDRYQASGAAAAAQPLRTVQAQIRFSF